MPHEGFVRAQLARARVPGEDIDEVIQDCYCRFAMLDAVEHIAHPQGYFLRTARNLLTRRIRHAKVVPIELVAEVETVGVDEAPSPERQAAARLDYARLRAMMAELPERCRRIVELRKFEGCSQREIAERMGVNEHIVENDIQLGIRTIRRAWREADEAVDERIGRSGEAGRRP